MASLVWGVPIFDFFKTYDHGIAPTLKLVGEIRSIADFNELIPAISVRVEIERFTDEEEIRVVSDSNGDYHASSDPSTAREILKVIDQSTSALFHFDVKAYPDDIPPGEEKQNDVHRHIIQYDSMGKRILPGIRRAGFLSTIEEYEAMLSNPNTWNMEEDFFVGITDASTGDVWWATADVAKDVLKRRGDMDVSCPLEDGQEADLTS